MTQKLAFTASLLDMRYREDGLGDKSSGTDVVPLALNGIFPCWVDRHEPELLRR